MRDRVSVVRCSSYDRAEVEARVREALALAGGLESRIRAGERVLIKPNLLSAAAPAKGVTTHPEVVRAVIVVYRELGAEVWVGDSPGFGSLASVAARCGITAVCEETGARLATFDRVREVSHPAGRVAKRFLLAEEVAEADKVISVGKLKTHAFMLYTGAVKNLYGTIAGFEKGRLHFSYQTPEQFGSLLVDLYQAVRPTFSVIDGIVAMEGSGPHNGPLTPLGLILAGENGFAVDAVAAGIIGLRPRDVAYIAEGAARELVSLSPGAVEAVGLPLAEARASGFQLPPGARRTNFPAALSTLLRNHTTARPVVIPELCIGCGICKQACPAGAIAIDSGKAQIDSDGCIRCYCCQEMCPQAAISLRRSRLGSLLHWR